jgi:hypothetical protein
MAPAQMDFDHSLLDYQIGHQNLSIYLTSDLSNFEGDVRHHEMLAVQADARHHETLADHHDQCLTQLAPSFLSASQLVQRQLFPLVCTDILFQLH